MGIELTENEINEFLARREDIQWLLQGLFADYEIKKAERRARTSADYDQNDLYVYSMDLSIVDFDHSSCAEGREDVIDIHLKSKNSENEAKDDKRDIEDFRNYMYSDCLNTIRISHAVYETYYSRYPTKIHKYREIQKKITDGNLLEVSLRDWKQIWNKASHRFDTFGSAGPVYYRFYQYGGVCTEESEYQGRTVKILFADKETSKKDLIKNGPVLFHKLPVEDSNVTGYMGSPSSYTDKHPLFLLFAPFIAPDRETLKVEELGGQLEKIKSGIFAAMEAFAQEHPDIAYTYLPMGDFLDVYKCAGFQKSPRKGLHRNIFSKECRMIPTDNGLISLRELFEKTTINPNPPTYTLKYKDKETLGAALERFRDTLGETLFEVLTERHSSSMELDHDFRNMTGKILLWDKYKDETKQICVIGDPLSLIIKTDVGNYRQCRTIERELLDEYMNPDKNIRLQNGYISVSPDLFCHVRSALFENPEEPVDEFVRTVLKEERITADRLFNQLRGMSWHKSFLNPSDPSSTILDGYAKQLSAKSVRKDDHGIIRTEPFMDFDGVDGFTELPQNLYEECIDCLGEDDFYDKEVLDDLTVSDILETAKYYDYKGDQAVCFWNDDSDGGHLVIFGEKAFDKLLKSIFC